MPTADAPKLQPPMEAANNLNPDSDPAFSQVGAGAGAQGTERIVTKQPKAEPLPTMNIDEHELGLRGGRFMLGCTCCDGMCSFHKGCC
ncbi:hypothetical protein N656DRAFT_797599 [Canariomyces notabilis]|uniref:Uncharacterized protein n=1 Tax=Canariomyces notabilis TaxID=2074819 RepID=A0AAN6TEQ6_9PEZI|nr:hypothetical protein N656DRAFT_797599 [Canariomyces arenarius]